MKQNTLLLNEAFSCVKRLFSVMSCLISSYQLFSGNFQSTTFLDYSATKLCRLLVVSILMWKMRRVIICKRTTTLKTCTISIRSDLIGSEGNWVECFAGIFKDSSSPGGRADAHDDAFRWQREGSRKCVRLRPPSYAFRVISARKHLKKVFVKSSKRGKKFVMSYMRERQKEHSRP